jgi:class 3 adenylate cyclase
MAGRRIPLQFKLIALLLAVVVVTGVVVVLRVDASMSGNLVLATDRALSTTMQTLVISLRNMMVSGEAPVLVNSIGEIKRIGEMKDVAIFRADGLQAFTDGLTLQDVNARLGVDRFAPTPRLEAIDAAMVSPEDLSRAVGKAVPVSRLMEASRDYLYYYPIENQLECQKCHGDANPMRGVAFVRASVAPTFRQIDETRISLAAFFGAAGLVITLSLAFFLRGALVLPVLRIGEVVRRVGEGDLSARTDIRRSDEVGELASKINAMIVGLEERFHLSKYVSSSTIDSIRSGGGGAGIERKRLAVLFTDVRGFTSYSETHAPETVVGNLNRVLQAQAEIVAKHGGDVDKYVGDAVMALFTDPVAAVACALELVAAVKDLDERNATELRIGAGVNVGDVIAGNIGSESRKEYAAVGDTVNVASRLCGIARRDMVVASQAVVDALGGRLEAVAVPDQKIKGKKDPITVYVVKSLAPNAAG